MKQNSVVKPAMGRSKITTALLAAVIALMALAVALFTGGARPTANAEVAGSITIHVYDTTGQYDKLAGWIWLKGGSGTEHPMSKTAADDEPFFKGDNKAHTMTFELTEKQLSSLKGSAQLGFLVCVAKQGGSGTFWNRYEKEGADVFLSVADAFDENNHADVYYVRKDLVAYTDIEEGRQAMEKIISANFIEKTASSITVQFEATTPQQSGLTAELYEGKVKKLETTSVTIDTKNPTIGVAAFSTSGKDFDFDFLKEYSLKLSSLNNPGIVAKTGLIDTTDFIDTFESAETQNLDFGAIYTKEQTIFRVWAPFATKVTLNVYPDGSTSAADSRINMRKRAGTPWGGVWEFTLQGDQAGRYYNYSITNNGMEVETIDMYARACGANGTRAMIIDLDTTDPVGWADDATWYERAENKTAVDTPIIWEVTVNDFSSSADSGMKYKGKFLAFTEQNTTVPGKPTLKTGVNYLKDLGVTYVHLNPVYDFASVDEADMTKADGSSYNWGYDPQNYNIPEGSYSTDPDNGAVRINEFKRMVQALHNAGIGVIMDVVYNHTFNTGGQAFHDTVPYYYHRTEIDGKFSDDSGCGNGTASERTMMRKFMVESLKYWAEEYHVDGFRFDLMGIHDVVTLNMVRAELDNVGGTGKGKRILMYGEPWDGYYNKEAHSYTKRIASTKNINANSGKGKYVGNANNKRMKEVYDTANGGSTTVFDQYLDPRIAVFNDSGREGLRGGVWAGNISSGWVNGAPGNYQRVRKMLEGGIGGNEYGAEGIHLGVGSRNVAYSCAHDNYTLWDHIRGKKYGDETALYYDDPVADDVKRCKLVASSVLMSSGMSFLLAGEEMGRTKYGNENSYDSPAKLNQINWSRQETFKELHDYYKNLIHLRRTYSAQLFSYSKTAATVAFSYGSGFEGNAGTGAFTFTRTQNGATLTLSLNPSALSGYVQIGTTKYNI
ncbi:MAG: hypothetical protein K2F90_04085 [Clostridiales bacterium]|nr:hypothetical protein [Clostridiales bacterium]